MNELEKHLFSQGYIKLQQGSYHIWISKKWHEMFVRRGLVRKNIYKQYVPNMETLKVFIEWMVLYDKVMHDKDFPKSNPFLTPGDREKIRFEIV